MATTTNYGWTTPDDTALVKDGASAIRTLGSSVDTTTKALNPSTTLGDIEYRSSTANTNTRLGIGSTGQVLTVNGGVPAWVTPSGGAGNIVLIASGTLSGTSVTLSSLSNYSELLLIMYGISNATANTTYGVRINNNSTGNYKITGTCNVYGMPSYFNDQAGTSFYHNRDTNRSTTNTFSHKFTNTKSTGYTDVDFHGFVIGDNGQEQDTVYKGVYTVSETVSSLVIMNYGGYSFNAGSYALYGG